VLKDKGKYEDFLDPRWHPVADEIVGLFRRAKWTVELDPPDGGERVLRIYYLPPPPPPPQVVRPEEVPAAIAAAQRERSKTLREMAQNSLFFFRAPQSYDDKAVAKHVPPSIVPVFEQLIEALRALEDWTAPAIHQRLTAVAEGVKVGLGKVAQPVRIAVSGATVSPPIDQTLSILGRTETLSRLERALTHWRR